MAGCQLFGVLIAVALASSTVAYRVKTVEHLNGQTYCTVREQPFFRVYHRPHFKVFRPGTPKSIRDAPSTLINHGLSLVSVAALAEALKTGRLPPPNFGFPVIGSTTDDELAVGSSADDDLEKGSRGRAQPKFGHHHLPAGETRDGASWPRFLLPYLKCMDLICECPLFNGTIERDFKSGKPFCRLPSGRPLHKAVRKEYRTLSRKERTKFLYFIQKMKTSGLYNRFGLIHRKRGVHAGPSFFPWHREFIKRLEMAYRMLNPDQGLPYWDSTLDNNLPEPADSVMFSEDLLGATDSDGRVVTGPFANWTTFDGRPTFERALGKESDGELFNDARIDYVMNQTRVDRLLAFTLPLHTCLNYELDDRFLEYSHDYTHYFIGGDMLERYSSSNDPIFFMHHGFVDLIWETWRQLRQTRAERESAYPRDDGECMPDWHFSYRRMSGLEPLTNRDGLSNAYTDNLYEYAPRPTCRRSSDECGSEFLFCDTATDRSRPKCTARVAAGGRCEGFEWSRDVCYAPAETCINGRCRADAPASATRRERNFM